MLQFKRLFKVDLKVEYVRSANQASISQKSEYIPLCSSVTPSPCSTEAYIVMFEGPIPNIYDFISSG